MANKIISSPHTHSPMTVNAIMRQVLYALTPGLLLSTVYFGVGILIHCIIAIIFALLSEAFVLKCRQQTIVPALKDGTAIITALLFALTISPFTPWWVSLTGIAFAIIVAKHLFGGLGNNPFNPAMTGYVFVLLCFPVQMAHWPDLSGVNDLAISLSQTFNIIVSGLPLGQELDALTGATPLSNMKVELGLMTMVSEIEMNPLYSSLGGKGWQWIALAYLAGGIWLIINKIIRWQIPVYILATIFIISFICHFIDSDVYPSALYHLFTGGTMLCAFFIATDPASSSTTPKGKIIYAVGVGLLVYIIRTWGSYPDGIAFAILIMNALVPLIDYYTRPKSLGEK
ncbi:MAG TPA: RnfABCDGE type electron transport complex subunit D [Thiotrichaceae bacterium]|jgi:electron transport complex protein RnfD|nr:RnfABCDGE type electron transport complex subunit D [Thiotrichaceae bacterium]HIM09103.1 RnfABCDGE type electron transport complex subunit D [Gammaproteobacteria bacterium]